MDTEITRRKLAEDLLIEGERKWRSDVEISTPALNQAIEDHARVLPIKTTPTSQPGTA